MDFFQKLDPNVPRKFQDHVMDSPILYGNPKTSKVVFITDSSNRRQITLIKQAMRRVFGQDSPDFTLLYAFTFNILKKDFDKNMAKYVFDNTINFKEYIEPGTKIISIGRAIYTLTKNTSFNASAFYAFDYVDSYFYHPELESFVFPVDDFFIMADFNQARLQQTFNSFFLFKQIQKAYSFNSSKIRIPTPKIEVVENPNEFLTKHKDKQIKVAWDLETTGLTFYKDNIMCITMSFDGITGYYLDFNKIDLKLLDEFFKNKYQIGANLKFDIKFLRFLGLKNVKVDFDTLNAGHTLNEMASNSLGSHGWRYTYFGGHEIELKRYLRKNPKITSFEFIPKSILSKYATLDSIVTFQAYKKQLGELKKDEKLFKYYFEQTIPNLNMFADIELDGVYVDWDYLKDLKEDLEVQKNEIQKEIYDLAGIGEFNISSQKELSRVLKEELKLPDIGFESKSGSYSTKEEAMNIWISQGYDIAKKIMDFRSIETQINTFVGDEKSNSAYWKFKADKTKTIHPNYMVMLTQSHRNKCNSPNFQQIPKRVSHAPKIRKMFNHPSEDFLLIEGDYSGFQMRVAAILSKDKNLIEAFTKYGGDVHSTTAVAIFHRDWTVDQFIKVRHEEPYKTQRDIAKGTNFAFLFGGSAGAFAESVLKVQWTDEYCRQFIEDTGITVGFGEDIYYAAGKYIRDSYFTQYPNLRKWHTKSHKMAETEGKVTSVHGARRLLPQLLAVGNDSNQQMVANFYNISKNSPVQNFEAVVIMRAMREMHTFLKVNNLKSSLFGMIHDAVEFYVHKDEMHIVIPKIFEIFEKQYEEYLGVPMVFDLNAADINKGEIWGLGRDMDSNDYKKVLFT